MILYAESSAVLSWLLEESNGDEVSRRLAEAEHILASELTILECERALIRLAAGPSASKSDVLQWQETLHRTADHWSLLGIDAHILARAGNPFPIEPIRTLDALHVATALAVQKRVPSLVVLSLDHRVRDNCRELGLEVAP